MSIISPLALEWFLFPLLRESQHTPPPPRKQTENGIAKSQLYQQTHEEKQCRGCYGILFAC